MFDFLPRLAVTRPVLSTMLVVLCLVLGTFSLSRLSIDLFPDVEFPVVTVATPYPGAGPEEIETQVTDRIEEAIATLANIDELRSFSQENVSFVVVQFDLGVDLDQAAIDVRDRIEAIRGELPLNVETPVVQRFDFGALPIMNLALAGPQPVEVLYEHADLLTTGVLFVFLHSWRGTIIAATAMPVTIVSTFLLMDAAGFTLNVMTLMALGITVGILVTNTIVVLENIYRRLDAGDAPRRAAWKGTAEIGVAVAASTLTNLVVFTPIAFMEGILGQFFYAFGLTVVFATLFSIFMSFTLAPLMAGRLLRVHNEVRPGRFAAAGTAIDARYRAVERSYTSLLGWSLARPRNGWIVIGGILAGALLTLVTAGRFVGGEFMPAGDEGAVQVTIELPPGVAIEHTSEIAGRAERLIASLADIESTLTTIGGAAGLFAAGGGANTATILVALRDDARPTDDVLRDLRPLLADVPDATIAAVATDPGGGGGGGAPLQVQIIGPDYDVLRGLAHRATTALEVPELSEVVNTVEAPRTELVFRPVRAALADHDLTVGQVGTVVRTSIEGTIAGVFRGEIGRERDIRVRLAPDARQRRAQVGELQIRSPHGVVPLAALGDLVEQTTPTAIQRVDRARTVQVDAQVGAGTLTDAAAAIGRRMAAIDLPPGYRWRLAGEFEQFGDAVGAILVALILAVVLTYIVLAMILESFVHPFTIMLTLPLGAVGAVLGLFLRDATMNIFSMMAIVMLVGIVVNNAILILDHTAQLRRKGAGITDALLAAAPARLRPIVMTNIAIVFALIPQAVGTGAGAVFRVPMAAVTIGGVLLSAVFTLFLIPVIYTKLDRFSSAPHIDDLDQDPRG